QLPGLGELGLEFGHLRVRDGSRQAGRPAAALEALPPAQVAHHVLVEMELDAGCGIEDVECLTVGNGWEIPEQGAGGQLDSAWETWNWCCASVTSWNVSGVPSRSVPMRQAICR